MTAPATKPATRDALVAAATTEFAEHGLDASLDAICARAGFTRGAFYVHFRDRDDLMVAVLDRVLLRQQETLLPEGGGDLASTIVRFVAMVAAGEGVTSGTPAWRIRHTLSACARVPALRARYIALQRRAAARVAATTARGQRDGRVRRDVDASAIGELLVVLSLGLSAAIDAGIPLDVLAGGAALQKLLARREP
ncbi:MAG TPA: helix-turn-helix domain-containing protein [Kofleriaceae bacterium]|nr:helix-turn-helix domain-containing protein [Kofleriaceae bacterium]